MRRFLMTWVVLSLLAVPALAAAEELRVFIWSEYMDEEAMPAAFEKETGIKVRLDIYENNEEMVAKLQAGGVSQYDIIVPSDYIMPVLINQKLIQPIDHAKVPNLKNLKPLFIFAAVRRGVTPQIHALSTLIMLITVVLVVATERITRKG